MKIVELKNLFNGIKKFIKNPNKQIVEKPNIDNSEKSFLLINKGNFLFDIMIYPME